ncbi:hypothetical protein BDV93DRAFT_556322 [Ceratobasidium sp. AG-I]|nr:hypothetical protein BDV93DRAFT_556322 [Ceratobasidium sp. AG-I]
MPNFSSTPQRKGIFVRLSQGVRWPKVTRKLNRRKFGPYKNIRDDQDLTSSEASSEVIASAYSGSRTTRTSLALYARVRRLAQPILSRFKFTKRQTVNNDAVERDSEILPPIRPHFDFARSRSSTTLTPATSIFSGTPPVGGVGDERNERSGDGDGKERIAQDRAIRAEQDAAYELSAEQDRERISAFIATNKLADELEAQIKEKAEQARLRRQEAEALKQTQIAWRRWARRSLVPASPEHGGIKIAVRLPCGTRLVSCLPASATLEALYTLVETFLIPSEYNENNDPEEAPEGYEHQTLFTLVMTNTPVVLPNTKGVRAGDLDILRDGVLIIVKPPEERLEEGGEDEDE